MFHKSHFNSSLASQLMFDLLLLDLCWVLIEMALTGTALKKLTKEDIIKPTLDLQDNFNQDLKSIKKNLSELWENFFKLETELAGTKQVKILCNQMVQVEEKSWSNEQ